MRRALALALGGLLAWSGAARAAAAPAAGQCGALRGLSLPDVRVDEAVQVAAADGGLAAHCRVSGVIGREIRFTVWLPDQWNERFVMGGGGGFVGSVQNQAIGSLNQGYATAGTDTGHQGAGILAGWAYLDLERQLNYGHLAVHRTATVAKAIMAAHYGVPPKFSYFNGCSNGGRQALMEAERYPDDFDGIVSGAPAYDFTRIAASFIRNITAAFPDGGARPVLTQASLELLERGVLDACDRLDGVADGILNDPLACRFELGRIATCPSGPASDCLTAEQAAVIRTIYAPTVVGGRTIYPGQPFGGEGEGPGWGAWIVGPGPLRMPGTPPVPSLQWSFGTEFFKYLVFADSAWDYRRYDLGNVERDTRVAASFLNADAADLSGLKASDGRLLLWHGWSDPALNARSTIDYHRRLLDADPDAGSYARLFLLPGVLHCAGGPGPEEVDWVAAIRAWVEDAKAPTSLVASKRSKGETVATRPVCAHPAKAVYDGRGDPKSAASYACTQ